MSVGRVAVLDLVRFASRQPTMHGLLEVDVTSVRNRLASSVEKPTLTAFVVATLVKAVAACPEVNARRAGRTIISFEKVDVVVTVEREVDGAVAPVPMVVVDAAHKDVVQITSELREAKARPLDGLARQSLLGRLPSLVRRLTAIMARRIPKAAARFGPPIGVSSLGMFGSGWGIPLSPMTLMVTVGGTVTRPVLSGGQIENHHFLPLTLSFDHSVIDGAPAARFATRFRHLMETASVLDEVR
ncbi:MAG TPA: 2-oxo acid dehydrogenase subunit E2 [Acidimicrobiia bacterium]